MSAFLLLIALAPCLLASELTYRAGETPCVGHLALPAGAKGPVAGVVVLPAWMGLDDHSKVTADRLATLGYAALAADIYGNATRAKDTKEAGELAGRFRGGDRALLRARIAAAVAALSAQTGVDAERIAVIGFCFGGCGALEAARAGLPVRGVVSIHGSLGTGTQADQVPFATKVLILHGAEDPLVPPAEVAAFMDEMRAVPADWQFIHFANARHAFTDPAAGTDPDKPVAYDERATTRSWTYLEAFLADALAR